MIKDPSDPLSRESIGIIGCGHLGRALASGLVSRGFPLEQLMLSRGKNESSLHRIIDAGLVDCLAENDEICRECGIVFISIRPQSLPDLQGLAFSKDALVVSCMAGVSLKTLKSRLGVEAVRMMPSGPDTIKEGKGIAAVYPNNRLLCRILQGLGLRVFELSEEEQMHVFTAGICLPAALLAWDNSEDARESACRYLSRYYPDFPEICSWAGDVLPEFKREEDKQDYIRKMATRGGVTEAIVQSLKRDNSLLRGLEQGMERSREISLFYECPREENEG